MKTPNEYQTACELAGQIQRGHVGYHNFILAQQ